MKFAASIIAGALALSTAPAMATSNTANNNEPVSSSASTGVSSYIFPCLISACVPKDPK